MTKHSVPWVLGEAKDPKNIPKLIEFTKSGNGNERRLAASALEKLSNFKPQIYKAVPHLIWLLVDDKSEIRQYSAKALGKMGSEEAIPYLKQLLNDEKPYVRKAANGAINRIKREIREETTNGIAKEGGWDYFVKGKKLFSKYGGDLSPEHVEEIEMSFRKAIELNPRLWAPHYYLGSLFYLTERYPEAKIEFEKALEKNIEPKYEQPIMYFLGEIKRIESGYSFPKDLEGLKKMTSNSILLNHALIEWFENTLREMIKGVLSREYGEEWWWEGVPDNVREKYGIRSQTTRFKEERELPELYFIDFYDYGKIIDANKRVFSFYTGNPKEWKKRLDDLEPIRNAIMHCRGQYLSEERISRLKESCIELQKLVQKVKQGEK
ncbi:MAG: HEAT repeat domain-containing protein [Euryarchaeota archaeon]|nr:HEAT repeat domain-containing protein [Euryarchaeota archaeon]